MCLLGSIFKGKFFRKHIYHFPPCCLYMQHLDLTIILSRFHYFHFTDQETPTWALKWLSSRHGDNHSGRISSVVTSLMAQTVKKICLQCRRPKVDPWVGKITWRRVWEPTPAFLPGEFHRQRSLAGYSLWGHKESDMTKWLTLSKNKVFGVWKTSVDATSCWQCDPNNVCSISGSQVTTHQIGITIVFTVEFTNTNACRSQG